MGLSIDREKVIKGLELCLTGDASACKDCPYDAECEEAIGIGPSLLRHDALALLKEQEPKQVIRKQGKRENSDGSIDYFGEWYCPHCGKLLNRGFDTPWIEFCYKCGKAVEWE